MRDILNDLETGNADPVRRAQAQMKQALPRRFYAAVDVGETPRGFVVLLDGKPVKTPGRAAVTLSTRAAAELIAAEFAAQGESIAPVTMPVTRLVNTATDGVAADPQAVLEDIVRFASTDLLFYRADGPAGLAALQTEHWDPVVEWARAKLGACFSLVEGVVYVAQPREAIAAVGAHLSLRTDPPRLAALHVMTTLTGSALLALAVETGDLGPDEAWTAAHVDEDWNISHWGEDAEAATRRASRKRDFQAAADLLAALG